MIYPFHRNLRGKIVFMFDSWAKRACYPTHRVLWNGAIVHHAQASLLQHAKVESLMTEISKKIPDDMALTPTVIVRKMPHI